jgi:hypothetical protein
MRSAYRVIAQLIALGVVLQASFVALGWFKVINDLDDGLVIDKDYDGNIGHTLHGIVGLNVLPLLGLILLIVAFFAKIEGGVKWAAFVLLAIIVQVALAFIAFGVPAVGALHGINAFVVLVLAIIAARRAALTPETSTGTREAAAV